MTNKIEISRELACPFCGSSELSHMTDDGIHFTKCEKCEATGPTGFKRGEDDAINWNTRAAPVVERQEPVAWMFRWDYDHGNGWSRNAVRFVESMEHVEHEDKSTWRDIKPLYTSPPAPVAVVHPFADKVIRKLQRFEECASDSGADGVDIGRHWLDLLTQLGLLNRVQRSPALWEITQQGEDCLDKVKELNQFGKEQ